LRKSYTKFILGRRAAAYAEWVQESLAVLPPGNPSGCPIPVIYQPISLEQKAGNALGFFHLAYLYIASLFLATVWIDVQK
jgi:hypothetical protein